jgi:hypothetical protein
MEINVGMSTHGYITQGSRLHNSSLSNGHGKQCFTKTNAYIG